MSQSLIQMRIRTERDVVHVRQRARQIAALVGFDAQDQTRISTAVSEIARNAFRYASGGRVEVEIAGSTPPQVLVVRVSDEGPGIANLPELLAGRDESPTGMGLGLIGVRRLMDQCDIATAPGRGTTVTLKRLLSRRSPVLDGPAIARVVDELSRTAASDPVEEVQRENQELTRAPPSDWKLDPRRAPILIVEDSVETLHLYERMLADSGYQLLPVRSLAEAREALAVFRPRAIVLDILLRGEDAWGMLTALKSSIATQDIPLAVISHVDDERRMRALGADAVCGQPVDRSRLLATLAQLVEPETLVRMLIVDDDEISRYVLRQHLARTSHLINEESTGVGGLRAARATLPDVIFLDLALGDLSGQEVLHALRKDARTREIPVVIVSASRISVEERAVLLQLASDVVQKELLSRERIAAALETALAGRAAA